jgi:lysophospholipase L1-like esterase
MEADGRGNRRHGWSRRLIQVVTGLSILAAVILVGGFCYGSYAALGKSVGGLQPGTGVNGAGESNGLDGASGAAGSTGPAGKTLHVVALGDSLTHGLGDASGNGYVGDVTQKYRQNGYTVIQSNLGIDGLTSAGLLSEMKQTSVQNLLPSANLILISIGGNDLNDSAGLPSIDSGRIANAQKQFHANLAAVLSNIRRVNPTATVALIGLYNPYGDVAASAQQTNAIVQSWDGEADRIAASYPRTVVVQTYDLFQLNPAKFLYVDHFHPNQVGYQRIADRVWQDLQGE